MEAWFLIVSRVLRLSAEWYHKAPCRWRLERESSTRSPPRLLHLLLCFLVQPFPAHQIRHLRCCGPLDNALLGNDDIDEIGRCHVEYRIEGLDVGGEALAIDLKQLAAGALLDGNVL